MPQVPSAGFFPLHTWSAMTPKAVRSCIVWRRRWCALLWLWGKNRAVLLDLGLEFFLEAAAHPLAPLGLDFQFQFTQRITSACIRVHLLAFRLGCSHSEKEPIFPVSIMAVVSSSAPRGTSALKRLARAVTRKYNIRSLPWR